MTITKRLVKGSPVTAAEYDGTLDDLIAQIAAKAALASPALTGTPTAPTAAAGVNTTQIATTAFVAAAIANLIASAPGALDTLNELAAALGDDPNFAATVTNALALKAPLASPALTGNPTAPTQTAGNNSTRLATTAFVMAAVAGAGGGVAPEVGSGAPSSAPSAAGLFYIDNNSYDLYFSTGAATVTDWRKAIDDTDGGAISAKGTPLLADTVFQFDSANSDAPVISTWTQIIAALALVTLDGSGRLVNPKTIYASYNGGTPAAASTYTPAAANGNLSHITNNAAFTLGVPANPGAFIVEVVNGATAGAITTSAYTKVTGDAFTTTNGDKFVCRITVTNSTSELNVEAMQ
ncbi:hypothetical protein LX70_02686 [Defluviimonas denitrificans]|jgi:hypothetical protein|uniref:Uncharacterized protein n=1 Tax=Albidovulum denitrificans TaxID=404881 RepID=A0A2S8S6J2_9RHOB|nr:hypothetical protein [Defluviimonas denitrificans]PQV56420.1 hypothetical protein LX70_02686 [Defluviimonas denitrificans]